MFDDDDDSPPPTYSWRRNGSHDVLDLDFGRDGAVSLRSPDETPIVNLKGGKGDPQRISEWICDSRALLRTWFVSTPLRPGVAPR